MSLIQSHLSSSVKAKKGIKIGIAVSEYNPEITSRLLKSCEDELIRRGVISKNIIVRHAPGAFEIPFACRKLARTKKYHALIALGAIIRGETPHFDLISSAVSQGIMKLNLELEIPIIFGILTTDNLQQALDRIHGGKRGDKGIEAARTALQMI